MTVMAPTSVGDLVDKLTILETKLARIADEGKLANVRREHDLLDAEYTRVMGLVDAATRVRVGVRAERLREVNGKIWDVEDAVRDCERRKDFGARFVQLARNVYTYNDLRAALKRQINDLCRSEIVEEKSYTT